jgi:drug/metabolite transporter (DMT)-like permease
MTHTQLASLLILTSGFAHAIVNAVIKAGKDKMSSRALIDGFSALLIAPAAFFVPWVGPAFHWLIISWAVHLVYLVSLVKAFERLDMSVAYPVARGIAPMLAAAGAVLFFNEPITFGIAAGILLVSGGVLAIGLWHKVDRKALGWSVLTGCSIALYTVVDAQGVRAAPTAMSYIVWTFIMLGSGIGTMFALWRGRAFMLAAASQWKVGLIAGALSILTYGLALAAFRWGATPKLAALRETSILFATVIAVVFLKERLTVPRIAGVLLIAGGAVTLLLQS